MTMMRATTKSVVLCALLCGGLARPGAAQRVAFTPVGSLRVPAGTIKLQGQYAYVAEDSTITIVDISNPAMPTRVGAYTLPARIWGFNVSGSFAYVAADLWGIGIVDISNPAAPALRGSFKTRGQAHAIDVWGTTALVADHMQGIAFFDVSNPAAPRPFGSVFLDGYPRHVAVLGSLAYAVDSPNGFYVIDPSKPPLDPLGSLQALDSFFGRFASIAVADLPGAPGRQVAVVTGARQLQIYDVSSPAAPKLLSRYNTPGGGDRMAMNGTIAYIADLAQGLQVVDLSVPEKPQTVGTYKTTKPTLDVALAGSLVFITSGSQRDAVSGRIQGDELLILRENPAP
jgi:hypothetical protein